MVVINQSVRHLSKVIQGRQALKYMAEGSSHLARAVQLTLGPAGRTVVIDPFERANFNALSAYPQPIITKDGVTVAKAINYLAHTTHPERGRL